MSKHGTASASGLFIEFLKVLIGAVPRDIPEDIAKGWMSNAGALTRHLQQALLPPEHQHLSMDSLEMAVAQAMYRIRSFLSTKVNRDLWFDNFTFTVEDDPARKAGRARVKVVISGWKLHPLGVGHHFFLRLDWEGRPLGWVFSEHAHMMLDPQGQVVQIGFVLPFEYDGRTQIKIETTRQEDLERLKSSSSQLD